MHQHTNHFRPAQWRPLVPEAPWVTYQRTSGAAISVLAVPDAGMDAASTLRATLSPGTPAGPEDR